MNDGIVKARIEDIPGKEKSGYGNYAYTKYPVTSRPAFDQLGVCFYRLKPGKAAYPRHFHHQNTECFYVISGQGTVLTDDGEIEARAGDVIVFPRGRQGTHKIINSSDHEDLVYLDVDTLNTPDVVEYPDSGKIGVFLPDAPGQFYARQDQRDYYAGEPKE